MLCQNCGEEIQPDSLFCVHCGERVKDSLDIIRWTYEMNMWKNPTILKTTAKVLLIASLAPALLVAALELENGFLNAITMFMKVAIVVIGIVGVLLMFAYPLVAIMQGGKYCVVFEMDKMGVKHIQMQKQFKRNQVLAMITTMAGAATGNLQVAGAGLLAGSRKSSYTKFTKVKAIKVNKKNHVIYLNETANRNQIYADTEEFDRILEFILGQCPKAQVRY